MNCIRCSLTTVANSPYCESCNHVVDGIIRRWYESDSDITAKELSVDLCLKERTVWRRIERLGLSRKAIREEQPILG